MLISLFLMTNFAKSHERKHVSEEVDIIKVVAPFWTGFTNKDGTGIYFDLVKLIYDTPKQKVSFEILPWARAVKYVDNSSADVLLGDLRDKNFFQSQAPLDIESAMAISLKSNKTEWHGEKSLKDKIVGFVRGYYLDSRFSVNVRIYNFENSVQGFGMLDKGRIDYFIQDFVYASKFIEENGINGEKYNFDPLWFIELVLRFSKTPKGKRLAEIYDKRFPIIYKDGRLEALFKKYQIPYVDPYSPSFEAVQLKVNKQRSLAKD